MNSISTMQTLDQQILFFQMMVCEGNTGLGASWFLSKVLDFSKALLEPWV